MNDILAQQRRHIREVEDHVHAQNQQVLTQAVEDILRLFGTSGEQVALTQPKAIDHTEPEGFPEPSDVDDVEAVLLEAERSNAAPISTC